jgi:hypothetical protein
MQECQYVVTGGFHHGHGSGELLAQHLGYLLPVGSDLLRLLDYKHCFHCRRHHVLACFGHVAQQVAQEVHPAPLPRAALEHPLDRRLQPQVGVRDHQPGASEATLLEASHKLTPESLGLAVAHGVGEAFSVAEGFSKRRSCRAPPDSRGH